MQFSNCTHLSNFFFYLRSSVSRHLHPRSIRLRYFIRRLFWTYVQLAYHQLSYTVYIQALFVRSDFFCTYTQRSFAHTILSPHTYTQLSYARSYSDFVSLTLKHTCAQFSYPQLFYALYSLCVCSNVLRSFALLSIVLRSLFTYTYVF